MVTRCFSPPERCALPRQQRANVEQVGNVIHVGRALTMWGGVEAKAKSQVVANRKVRKQAGILKNISQPSFRRQVYALPSVKTGKTPAGYLPAVGPFQPGKAVDKACLARAGGAKIMAMPHSAR